MSLVCDAFGVKSGFKNVTWPYGVYLYRSTTASVLSNTAAVTLKFASCRKKWMSLARIRVARAST
jgi:hypothetical protein